MPSRACIAAERLRRCGVILFLFAIVGCAGMPLDQAAGTPAHVIARDSLVSLQAHGVTIGAAVAVPCAACGGTVLITNAHVLRQAGSELELRAGDGGDAMPADLIATSPLMDLAVLRAPTGLLRPARLAEDEPGRGARLWAVGPQGLGRAIAEGRVRREAVRMRSFGPGFTAEMGALMGFSGGPVVDAQGRVVGLTTALAAPGMAPVMAALTGFDIDGLVNGRGREVFVLAMPEIAGELERMAGRGALAALARENAPRTATSATGRATPAL